jgi:hypothetical protein
MDIPSLFSKTLKNENQEQPPQEQQPAYCTGTTTTEHATTHPILGDPK